MGYRVKVYSSHKVLASKERTRTGKREFVHSSTIPNPHYELPFRTKQEAENAKAKQVKYNEKHNKMFLFRYTIVKTK